MANFSSLQQKVNALKAKVEQSSITPNYLGSILDDCITQMQAIDADQNDAQARQLAASAGIAAENALRSAGNAESAVFDINNKIGHKNGIATLDSDGTLSESQFPAIKDNVMTFAGFIDDKLDYRDDIIHQKPADATSGDIVHSTYLGQFLYRVTDAQSGDVSYFSLWNNCEKYGKLYNSQILPVAGKLYFCIADGTFYHLNTARDCQLIPVEGCIDITYNELRKLIGRKRLRSGRMYRIIDYVTTVANDPDARSAGHPFDIIVTAISNEKLDEHAIAINSARDTDGYFADSILSAWKVWYCFDNDTDRFNWADTENGKGVIYRLIDEWNNDCPYDFKNIQFKRYLTTGSFLDDADIDQDCQITHYILGASWGLQGLSIDDANDFCWFYTFSKIYDVADLSDLSDASLIRRGLYGDASGGEYWNQACHSNTIKPYFSSRIIDNYSAMVIQILNDIVISAEDESINGNAVKLYANTWATGCFNMTFHEHCYNNTFGPDCFSFVGFKFINNSFGYQCGLCKFGFWCCDNTFGNGCFYNTFLYWCQGNTFGSWCSNNTFGSCCSDNSLGAGCQNIIFGYACLSNIVGIDCYKITLGNDCRFNKFGIGCAEIIIENFFEYSHIGNGSKCLFIKGGTADDLKVKNLHVLPGTAGKSSGQYLTINIPKNTTVCYFAGLNSDGVLRIWTPADMV